MKNVLISLLAKSLEKNGFPEESIEISIPVSSRFGNFSSNIAMKLAKKTGKNPIEIGNQVIEKIPANDIIRKAEVVPPGFINFYMHDTAILEAFASYAEEKITLGKGKTVVTDCSHPNIAKPMGIHHLLSTIIGSSLNYILAFCGYTVIKDNFLGDYGTQFGKLIYAYKTWGDKELIEKNPIPELLALYVQFHNEAEKDAAIDDQGRKEFQKLEQGDEENRKLWQWIVDISLQEFLHIYERLQVSFDTIHGESFYEDKMAPIVVLGKQKGVFVPGEKGALICRFPEESLPTCVIQKSDGATMYHLRDLARKAYLEKTYHPDLVIVVVDSSHEMHFKQLFTMIKMLGIAKGEHIHVPFGRMQFKDAKMSTRKGNIIPLEDVLDEAVRKSKELIMEKKTELSDQEQEKLAEMMGIGAVKYAILSQNRNTNIIFDWNKIISLEGNSAPYLQYTYARGMSILKKANVENTTVPKTIDVLEETEKAVMLKLMQFNESVIAACKEYKPNILATYLHELAQLVNSFYNKTSVLNAEGGQKQLRLKIVHDSCNILKVGLGLLGIEVPERM